MTELLKSIPRREWWIHVDNERVVSFAYPTKEYADESCSRGNKEEIHVVDAAHVKTLVKIIEKLEEQRDCWIPKESLLPDDRAAIIAGYNAELRAIADGGVE